jgi:hypothetical protein
MEKSPIPPTPPQAVPSASLPPGGGSTTPQPPSAPPPHALLPKDGQSTNIPKPMGLRGKRSPFDDMDPRLAKTIDNELVAGTKSLRVLGIQYGLTIHQLAWRKRVLHQSMGKGKAGELAGRAGEAMDWAAERTKEIYQTAAEKKTPVLDANGNPLMTTLEQAGREIETALLLDSPDIPSMLAAVKQMHELARSFGEFEHRIGKIAELEAQKALGIGLGANNGQGMGGGWGGVGQLNVLVMPKEAGVEAGGPMPRFQLPAPPVQQGQLEAGEEVIDVEEESSD